MSRKPCSSVLERWYDRTEARWISWADRTRLGSDPYSGGKMLAAPFVMLVCVVFVICAAGGAVLAEWLIARGMARGAGAAVMAIVYMIGPLVILTTLVARASLRCAAEAGSEGRL